MKTVFEIIFLLALVYILLKQEERNHQNRIEKRALLLEQKDCYDWQDIEYIVFGETQE
jgi:hypothetical protein